MTTSRKTTTRNRTPAMPKDPHEVERRAYLQQMLDEGFDPADAKTIAEKTVFPTAQRRAPSDAKAIGDVVNQAQPARPQRAQREAKAIGDLLGETPAKPAPPPPKTRRETPIKPVYDYRYEELPSRVRDLIEAHLAIETADAKAAGSIGFMTRALAIATLPHRRVAEDRFVRKNGDFTLTMLTAHPEGLPYGTLPRLLLTWVCSEAVRTKEPVLSLGTSLASYLRELGLKNTGGKRGDITRLKHAMTTMFSAIISCRYEGRESWALQNVLLADRVEWWEPQNRDEAGEWQSRLLLSRPFFQECVDHPVPINMIAMKALRHSPLALDIYVWLTHRMSYLSKRTTIPWISLSAQFGADYARNDQGLRDFRRAFLRELKHVLTIYNTAKVSNSDNGLVLYPSPTHVPPKMTFDRENQGLLQF
ncbi:replication protein RepA [Methylobacterium radiotolerans]|uniref:Plasmid encoded RepA protein n=1 Tax=Methylobacterium radiotolerans (strain ATCC 27329 / DSM 1819 / JCM 2831 / NBRC 15690 / NCIMB 10815 / 0-1) TaxID=426355 RepID=B1M9Q1_METRJ|nr:replication protein RepA [Methylobacterium radiotolerans]ACB28226.1 plasmid encoded RepA protein [Methylobacterium radiotolerans JCM 2831]GEN01773.1 hypothetical protein MRA01_63120 [Methylobacterium radiotolerans]